MDADDIRIEVHDGVMIPRGNLRLEDCAFKATVLFNAPGTWQLDLDPQHPLAAILAQPGSGITVFGPGDDSIGRPEVLFAGPMVKATFSRTPSLIGGAFTATGTTYDVLLDDRVCLPDPTNPNPATQTLSHDVRTGNVESLMHAYVNANLGVGAVPSRKDTRFVAGVSANTGPTITKQARFTNLGTLVTDLSKLAPIRFRVATIRPLLRLQFQTSVTRDLSDRIVLSYWNNSLASEKVSIGALGAATVIVAGQGEQTERKFYSASTAESLAAANAWNRKIERFVDQRQTDDNADYVNKANEILADEGHTEIDIQVVPIEDDNARRLGNDWGIGDIVTVSSFFGSYKTVTSGIAYAADGGDGFRMGALIGDVTPLNVRQLNDITNRLAALERGT